jgi:uncharacterized protein (TIGR03437 family)
MAWRFSRLLFLLALSLLVVRGQPFLFYRGILNAASFAPSGLPNGSIARGSIFSVFGRDLGPTPPAQATAFPLGRELAGVSLEVCQGESCVAAIPLYVAAGQINAVMPSNAPLGQVSLRASFNGQKGNPSPATVVEASLGIFTVHGGGFGPGIVQNFLTQDNQPINSKQASARRGQTVVLWGTGLGPALGADDVAPQVGDLATPVEIFVGGKRAGVKRYSGRSPCCAGVDQIIFDIPEDAPDGCYVPVQVRGGAVVSNTVTMAIAGGGACQDTGVTAAARFGTILLERKERLVEHSFGPPLEIVSDSVTAGFLAPLENGFFYHPYVSRGPAGSCVVYQVRGDIFHAAPAPGVTTIPALDAGASLSFAAAGRTVEVPVGKPGEFVGLLGGQTRFDDPSGPLLFEPGADVVVRGPGGGDVGSFEVRAPIGEAVRWTNRDESGLVDRAQGALIEFGQPPAGGGVDIWGGVYDQPSDASTMFACGALPGATRFLVPPEILANVPATRPLLHQSNGWLWVALWHGADLRPIAANGLAAGWVAYLHVQSRTTEFQ